MSKKNELLSAYGYAESVMDSKNYLEKYFVPDEEYLAYADSVMSEVFDLNAKFPDFVFKHSFFLTLKGGALFTFKDLEKIKECMRRTGDTCFLVFEDYDELSPPHSSGPALRFKYPNNIEWELMCINDGISYELFKRPIRNFYVFGNTGKWGRYVANDSETPLDIFGFDKEFRGVFEHNYNDPIIGQNEILEWLPPAYKEKLAR